jgi:hypothetical protein
MLKLVQHSTATTNRYHALLYSAVPATNGAHAPTTTRHAELLSVASEGPERELCCSRAHHAILVMVCSLLLKHLRPGWPTACVPLGAA